MSTDETPTPADPRPGRRVRLSSERKVDVLVALGVVLPATVAVAVALIGNEANPLPGVNPPTTSALTSTTIVCPTSTESDGSVRAARVPDVPGGEVHRLTAKAPGVDRPSAALHEVAGPVQVPRTGSARIPLSENVQVLVGSGDGAPGLVAGREASLAVPECRGPAYDEWYVGLGASARYASVLELVNPDAGEAIVDVELMGPAGPIEEPKLRGIPVPRHGVVRVDLAAQAPRKQVTAAHLMVTRGRVTASARTTLDLFGTSRPSTDYLPATAAPSRSALFLGLPGAEVAPVLYVANPSQDEVRASVKLVTASSTFTPTNAPDITIAPGAVEAVGLDKVLSGKSAEGVVGMVVESSSPVASSVRLRSGGDLVLLAPALQVHRPATVVLPAGRRTLLLAGAERAGTVHVVPYDAAGKAMKEVRVEVNADRAFTVQLPDAAVTATVEARNTDIAGVVSARTPGKKGGVATVRLRDGDRDAQVPAVGPR